jgi:hypothetical protein
VLSDEKARYHQKTEETPSSKEEEKKEDKHKAEEGEVVE